MNEPETQSFKTVIQQPEMVDKLKSKKASLLFEHFLMVGPSPEKAAEAVRKMELNNQSFTSKMIRKLGEIVLSNSKKQSNPQSRKEEPFNDDDNYADHNRSLYGSYHTSASEFRDNLRTSIDRDFPERGSTTTGSTTGEDINLDPILPGDMTPAKRSSLSSMMSIFKSRTSVVTSTQLQQISRTSSFKTTDRADAAKLRHELCQYSDFVEPSLLYHYPYEQSPPEELCDFCMPMGCRLHHISDDINLQEVFYGQKQSVRSGKSFTFILENKESMSSSSAQTQPQSRLVDQATFCPSSSSKHSTAALNEDYVEESGFKSERLYGFCVIHNRYLNVSGYDFCDDEKSRICSQQLPTSQLASHDFEAPVCFAFLSKFPFNNLFFQLIYDIINTERLVRLEMIDNFDHQNCGSKYPLHNDIDRHTYSYLQRSLLEEILSKLIHQQVPFFGERLSYQVSPNILPIDFFRQIPQTNAMGEYAMTSANWALPVLFSWVPLDTLVWVIGLILCEAKVIVVGSEVGMVSCAVAGLLSLIQPLKWVGALIPILPSKHIEFVESPVPLIAGLVVDSITRHAHKASHILKLCNDEENGTITAVFDVGDREVYISNCNNLNIPQLVLPGAEGLLLQLKSKLLSQDNQVTDASSIDSVFSLPVDTKSKNKSICKRFQTAYYGGLGDPIYSVTPAKLEIAKDIQNALHVHLQTIIEMTQDYVSKDLMRRDLMLAIKRASSQRKFDLESSPQSVISSGITSEQQFNTNTNESVDSDEDKSNLFRRNSSADLSPINSTESTQILMSPIISPLPTFKSTGSGVKNVIISHVKSLRWSGAGGIILGDGAGSTPNTTQWVNAQLGDISRYSESTNNSQSPIHSQKRPQSVKQVLLSQLTDSDDDVDDNDDEDEDDKDIMKVLQDSKLSPPRTEELNIKTNGINGQSRQSVWLDFLSPTHGDKVVDSDKVQQYNLTSSSRVGLGGTIKDTSSACDSSTVPGDAFNVIGLTRESVENCDVDEFIRRFASTQLYLEYDSALKGST